MIWIILFLVVLWIMAISSPLPNVSPPVFRDDPDITTFFRVSELIWAENVMGCSPTYNHETRTLIFMGKTVSQQEWDSAPIGSEMKQWQIDSVKAHKILSRNIDLSGSQELMKWIES